MNVPEGRSLVARCIIAWKRIAVICACLWLSPAAFACGGDVDLAALFQQWRSAAMSIRSVELNLAGEDYRPEFNQSNLPPNKQMNAVGDVRLPLQIDWRFARPSLERYHRVGLMPVPSDGGGSVPMDELQVNNDQEWLSLFAGGGGVVDYDLLDRKKRAKFIREPALLPIRFLLNIWPDREVLDATGFDVISQHVHEINGVQCVVVNKKQGATYTTIWSSRAVPHLIQFVDFGTTGGAHTEMRYEYASPPMSVNQFWMPTAWTITGFPSGAQPLYIVQCKIVAAHLNPTFSPSVFQIEIPPGTIISDYMGPRRRAFVRQADGSERELTKGEDNLREARRIAALIVGSRIYGKLANERRGRLLPLSVVALSAIGFAALLITLWLRRSRLSR